MSFLIILLKTTNKFLFLMVFLIFLIKTTLSQVEGNSGIKVWWDKDVLANSQLTYLNGFMLISTEMTLLTDGLQPPYQDLALYNVTGGWIPYYYTGNGGTAGWNIPANQNLYVGTNYYSSIKIN